MHPSRNSIFTAVQVKPKSNISLLNQKMHVVMSDITLGLTRRIAKTTIYIDSELIHSVIWCKNLIFSWDYNLFHNEPIITQFSFFYQSCMHTFFSVTFGIMKSLIMRFPRPYSKDYNRWHIQIYLICTYSLTLLGFECFHSLSNLIFINEII